VLVWRPAASPEEEGISGESEQGIVVVDHISRPRENGTGV